LNHVRASRLTDAELIYTPSQIALAAFSIAWPEIASQWAATKEPAELNGLSQVNEDIKLMITSCGRAPNIESVREVDRRLKLCKNPEKVIGSKAYLARKREEDQKLEEKRNKKVGSQKKGMDESDPFGIELSQRRTGLVDYDDDDEDDC
jgi:cyclin H